MSKNKSLRRIDKEYGKDIRYPDINDYLKDTSYNVLTSSYHDNLIDTQLTYRMQDEVLGLRQIGVANTPVQAYFNSFVLYGYHPDLESVSEIRLTIDEFSTEVENAGVFTYVPTPYSISLYNNSKNSNRWSVILQALQPTLNANKIVNYGIFLNDATVATLYNYVFNTAAIQSKVIAKYIHDDMYQNQSSPVGKLIEFVKENIYTLSIPIRVEFFYVEDDGFPAFTFITNFDLKPVLVKLRNTNKLRSLSASLTPYGTSEYNRGLFFKWDAVLDSPVDISPSYKFDLNGTYTETNTIRFNTLQQNKSTVYNRFVATQHQIAAHTGFNIQYPPIYVQYDWKWADGSTAFVNTSLELKNPIRFNNFTPTGFTILDYFIGYTPNLPYNTNDGNTFKIGITFALPNGVSFEQLQASASKFQLRFFNGQATKFDRFVLLAGSVDKPEERLDICHIAPSADWYADFVNNGVAFFRATAVNNSNTKVKLFSAVVNQEGVIQNPGFFTWELIRYITRIQNNGDNTCTFIVEWIYETTDAAIKFFWPFAHFGAVELTFTDFFQRHLYSGALRLNTWDVYSIQQNPFRLSALPTSNPSRYWYPRVSNLNLTATNFSYTPSNTVLDKVRFQNNNRHSFAYLIPKTNSTINVTFKINLFCKSFNLQSLYKIPTIMDVNFLRNGFFHVGAKANNNTYTYKVFSVADEMRTRAHLVGAPDRVSFHFPRGLITIPVNTEGLKNIITSKGYANGRGVLVLMAPFRRLTNNDGKIYFEFEYILHNNIKKVYTNTIFVYNNT